MRPALKTLARRIDEAEENQQGFSDPTVELKYGLYRALTDARLKWLADAERVIGERSSSARRQSATRRRRAVRKTRRGQRSVVADGDSANLRFVPIDRAKTCSVDESGRVRLLPGTFVTAWRAYLLLNKEGLRPARIRGGGGVLT